MLFRVILPSAQNAYSLVKISMPTQQFLFKLEKNPTSTKKGEKLNTSMPAHRELRKT